MGSLRKHQPGKTTDLLMSPFLRLQQEVNHAMSDFYNLFDLKEVPILSNSSIFLLLRLWISLKIKIISKLK